MTKAPKFPRPKKINLPEFQEGFIEEWKRKESEKSDWGTAVSPN